MIQVYQKGIEHTDSFGTQHFTVVIGSNEYDYFFEEGSHVNIDAFIQKIREANNNEEK